jgi:hypothetical protein
VKLFTIDVPTNEPGYSFIVYIIIAANQQDAFDIAGLSLAERILATVKEEEIEMKLVYIDQY